MKRFACAAALSLAAPSALADVTQEAAALTAVQVGLRDQDPALVLGGLTALKALSVTDAPDATMPYLAEAGLSAMLWARGDAGLTARLANSLTVAAPQRYVQLASAPLPEADVDILGAGAGAGPAPGGPSLRRRGQNRLAVLGGRRLGIYSRAQGAGLGAV